MNRTWKVGAGSAARAAEERKRAEEAEGFSGARPQGIRLAPRASSTPAPEAVPREQFQRNLEIKVSRAVGQKFERPAAPAEPASQPAAPPPAAPPGPRGLAGSLKAMFFKLFRRNS